MGMWKTLRVSHIPTPPTTATDKCPTRRYTNNPLGTKDRSGHPPSFTCVNEWSTVSVCACAAGKTAASASMITSVSPRRHHCFRDLFAECAKVEMWFAMDRVKADGMALQPFDTKRLLAREWLVP